MLKKSSVKVNQISWLFHQKLPARVHLIATIKMVAKKTDSHLQSSSSISSQPSTHSELDESTATVSLFATQLNELKGEQSFQQLANSLFELPRHADSKQKAEISEFIKTELAKRNAYLTRGQTSLVIYNAANSGRFMSVASGETTDACNFFFQYISLVFYELTDTYNSLFVRGILDKHSLPFDCESLIRAKLCNFIIPWFVLWGSELYFWFVCLSGIFT